MVTPKTTLEQPEQERCCECHKPVSIPAGFAKDPEKYSEVIELDNCDFLHQACAVAYFSVQCKDCGAWYPLVNMDGYQQCECGGTLEKRTKAQVKAAWAVKPKR